MRIKVNDEFYAGNKKWLVDSRPPKTQNVDLLNGNFIIFIRDERALKRERYGKDIPLSYDEMAMCMKVIERTRKGE